MRMRMIRWAVVLGLGFVSLPAASREQQATATPSGIDAVEDPDPEGDAAPVADAPPAQAPAVPAAPDGVLLFHWPVSEARPDGKDLAVSARWLGAWHGKALRLHFRRGTKGTWNESAFVLKRDTLEARIPAGDVRAPGIAYWIESIEADGTSRARFGSEDEPQVVRITEDSREQRLKDRLAGHDGHRFRAEAVFRHVDFGKSRPDGRRSEDNFNELRIGFTYRPLLAGLYQVEGGILIVGDRLGVRTLDPPATGRPGAYLAYMKLYWEFGDVFGLEPLLMLGASRQGLEPGGGITFRVGAVRSTHLDIGIKGARTLGWSFTTELDVKAARFVKVRVRNEITNWPTNPEPHSDDVRDVSPYGILPSLGLAFMLPGGVEISGSLGYGIRKGYDRGWLHGSAGVAVEF